jgi:hypothetical protein
MSPRDILCDLCGDVSAVVSVETGEWRPESGDWRMETGEWRMENGDWYHHPVSWWKASLRDGCPVHAPHIAVDPGWPPNVPLVEAR